MRVRVGKLIYDSAARLTRYLPHFRGKWQVVDFVSRAGLPFRSAGDALRTVRMKDGSLMIWDLRDISERRAAWLGIYDEFIRQAIVARLAPGAVVLDVGANVGAWTIPLARQIGTAGTVCAFEPVPANLRRLEQSIALNAILNVQVSSIALGDGSRSVDMWLKSEQTGADSGTAAVVPVGTGHLTVSMCTLDEWTASAGLQRLDFIKLDVEGAEFLVLAGATHVLKQFRPLILAEFDEYWMTTHGNSAADIARWAAAWHYRVLRWNRHERCFVPTDLPSAAETLLVPDEHI